MDEIFRLRISDIFISGNIVLIRIILIYLNISLCIVKKFDGFCLCLSVRSRLWNNNEMSFLHSNECRHSICCFWDRHEYFANVVTYTQNNNVCLCELFFQPYGTNMKLNVYDVNGSTIVKKCVLVSQTPAFWIVVLLFDTVQLVDMLIQ